MVLPPEMIQGLVEHGIPFLERMNLKVLEVRPGYVKLFAPLKGNENHVGGVYAGAQFTLAEIPGGALCLAGFDSTKYYPIIKEMNLKFLRPALTDLIIETSISETEANELAHSVEKTGKAEFILEGAVKDTSGQTVAVSRSIYQIRSRKMDGV